MMKCRKTADNLLAWIDKSIYQSATQFLCLKANQSLLQQT